MSRLERPLLAVLALIAGAVWAFLYLADEVKEGSTAALDRSILLWFRHGQTLQPLGPRWLQETERDFTALGGFTVLTLITVFAAVMLLIHGRRIQAAIFFAAVCAAQVLSEVVKAVIAHPRPDIVPQFDLTYSSSFPSGHAMMAPVVYLTLAALVAAGDARRSSRAVLIGGAIALVAAIGVSRVYLGVHWPSDVLGGWALGGAIALLASWGVFRVAPSRGANAAVAPDTSGAA